MSVWGKFNPLNLLSKSQQPPPSPEQPSISGPSSQNGSVMSGVYEAHPNLSVFHDDATQTSPKAPVTPKGSMRSMFRRSKLPKDTSLNKSPSPASLGPSSPAPSSLGVSDLRPKKSKRVSAQSVAASILSTASTVKPQKVDDPTATLPPTTPNHPSASSRSIARDKQTHNADNDEPKGEKSRVAFEDLTNQQSTKGDAAASGMKAIPEEGVHTPAQNRAPSRARSSSRPILSQEIFSPPNVSTPLPAASTPLSQQNLSRTMSESRSIGTMLRPSNMPNLFDLSQDLDSIPMDGSMLVMDPGMQSLNFEDEIQDSPAPPRISPSPSIQEAKPAVKASTTAFFSFAGEASNASEQSSPNLEPPVPKDKTIPATPPLSRGPTPEQDAPSPQSTGSALYDTPDHRVIPRIEKTRYFTPLRAPDLIQPYPEEPKSPVESADVPYILATQDRLLASLRAELAVHNDISMQYEAELSSQEELVEQLSSQLEAATEECSLWRNEGERKEAKMRKMRERLRELERLCEDLNEEVERREEESVERVMLDAASGHALSVLHARISGLENTKAILEAKIKDDEVKGEMEKEARERAEKETERLQQEVKRLAETVGAKEQEVMEMRDREVRMAEGAGKMTEEQVQVWKEHVEKLEETRSNLDHELQQARSELEEMRTREAGSQATIAELQAEVSRREQECAELSERTRTMEFEWAEERTVLASAREAADVRCGELDAAHGLALEEIKQLQEQLKDFSVMKEELEAQWQYAEKANTEIKELEIEREELAHRVVEVEAQAEELMLEKEEWEKVKVELDAELREVWEARDELEQDRDKLAEELKVERGGRDELTEVYHQTEHKLSELERDHEFVVNNGKRLEELLRQRDAELTESQERSAASDKATEEARAALSKMTREHMHALEDHTRALQDITDSEMQCRRQMEDAIKRAGESDINAEGYKEQVGNLREELEKLRKQVHELQQASAAKEVQLSQLIKAKAQDKADKEGLNIALDSKQQELELIKRKLAIRGTGGVTPAPSRATGRISEIGSRRQTMDLSTPAVPSSSVARLSALFSDTEVEKEKRPIRLGLETPGPNLNSSVQSNATVTSKQARLAAEAVAAIPSIRPRPRSSLAATPTPGYTRRTTTSMVGPSAPPVPRRPNTVSRATGPAAHRRTISVSDPSGAGMRTPRPSVISPGLTSESEKENLHPAVPKADTSAEVVTATAPRRRTLVPAS
ncbi:hypothetical protein BOTBODRAFT_30273 [Botryobasidium botryosum FD-172 SS1]|uniref:Uncharacterized protein n=1 Tax=Botryobasidium botryosum (strain FD-172 SS1) TaxID=930990 RepID=A0A067MQD3_BOTB1|nr:hypothetical protein BOTBODRAFT_30273 [Botryobasidium botryosum FD-172 SS1]